MTELKEVFMDIRKELRGADKYAHEAVKHKAEYPALADVYHRIANDKLVHTEMLHKQAHEMAMKHHLEPMWDIEDWIITHDMDEIKKCMENYRK